MTVAIELVPHDPAWAAAFADEAPRLRSLGDVHHVGSTSVPGLAAKPIIDIVLAVADSADEAAYVPALEAIGYRVVLREPAWFEHRQLKRDVPAVNLHVFTAGCDEIERMLRFRDHLRRDAADRQLYEATKRELATRTWLNVRDYAAAKTEVVAAILARAMRGSRE